jgi:hypothetical protein
MGKGEYISTASIAFRLGAVETLTLSERSLIIGREGVGFEFRTSPGNENTRMRQLFYFILLYIRKIRALVDDEEI